MNQQVKQKFLNNSELISGTDLEQHLRSTENFKASQNPNSLNTGASDPNLIKKSIENVVAESM